MKKQFSKTLFVLLALGLAMPAFARTSLHDMQREQARSIQQGIHSGELTRAEVRVLRQEQSNIQKLERRYLRDRHLSRGERRTLMNRYTQAGRHIYRLKHNRQRNYAYGYNPHSPHGNHGIFGSVFH